MYSVDFLYSTVFNRLTAVYYTDKLEKLPKLMDFVEDNLGYEFVKKSYVKDEYGSLTGEVGYGYRKNDILVIFETGVYENLLTVKIINEAVR